MRINSIIKLFILTLSIWLLSGCGKKGWFHDRSQDYDEAKSCPSLKIPPSVQAEPFSSEYQIPEA